MTGDDDDVWGAGVWEVVALKKLQPVGNPPVGGREGGRERGREGGREGGRGGGGGRREGGQALNEAKSLSSQGRRESAETVSRPRSERKAE